MVADVESRKVVCVELLACLLRELWDSTEYDRELFIDRIREKSYEDGYTNNKPIQEIIDSLEQYIKR